MGKCTAVFSFDDIIGQSEPLQKSKEKAIRAAYTVSPLLIYGETGTGKELFVQAIHNFSQRKNKPFIAQNCAAIPETLLEGILFGTVKGGFTGAENRKGLFEEADGGTLYLDELNSMPLELQAKLLRVIQEGVIRRVGDTNIKRVDVRIITSLNEEPEKIVETGKLRKDLFYRLNVVRINLSPLRERKEDIPILVHHFINKFNKKFGMDIIGIDDSALKKIIKTEWSGNVRQLEHFIESIFNNKHQGIIELGDLQEIDSDIKNDDKPMSLRDRLEEAEKNYIMEALVISNNNVTKASELLDIPRQTLQYKIKKYFNR